MLPLDGERGEDARQSKTRRKGTCVPIKEMVKFPTSELLEPLDLEAILDWILHSSSMVNLHSGLFSLSVALLLRLKSSIASLGTVQRESAFLPWGI